MNYKLIIIIILHISSDYVRRLLSLEMSQSNLQGHKYTSMALFERDFYELLNNGRQVTEDGSQVRSPAVLTV